MRPWIALAMLLGSAFACSARVAPRLAKPFDSSEQFAYRTLTREDFKSKIAQGFSTVEEERLRATLCTQIMVRPPDVVTRARHGHDGVVVYTSTIEDPIFFAAVSRKCSWWNADGRDTEMVLEHEQVHFANTELAARRLNASSGDIARRVHRSGTDLGEVSQGAQAALRAVIEDAQTALLALQDQYDEEVFRLGRNSQRQWFSKVTAELEATSALARGPQVSIQPTEVHEAAPPSAPALPTMNPTTTAPSEPPAPPQETPATPRPAASSPAVPTQSFPEH